MALAKQSLKVIACEIAQREICWLSAQTPHLLDLEFLPVGHHDDPKNGHQDLQNRINRIAPGQYDAILVGYGICNQMVSGLTTPHTTLIIPRAHDCITFFLGSKERYQEVFRNFPGTFFFTAGWLEFTQRKALHQSGADAMREAADHLGDQMPAFGLDKTFGDLVAKYGEDNARYLMDVSGAWAQNYRCGALIGFDFDAALRTPGKGSGHLRTAAVALPGTARGPRPAAPLARGRLAGSGFSRRCRRAIGRKRFTTSASCKPCPSPEALLVSTQGRPGAYRLRFVGKSRIFPRDKLRDAHIFSRSATTLSSSG